MLTISGWLRYDAIQRLWPEGVETVLEVGAGQGALGMILARKFDYVGIEPDPSSFAVAKRRLGDRVLNVSDERYAARGFDLVCCFEVVEHVEDDAAMLARMYGRVRQGGWALVSFPAGRARFNRLDAFAGHHRRYDRQDVFARLHDAGFEDVAVLGWGFPLANIVRALSTLVVSSSNGVGGTAMSGRWMQPRGSGLPRRLLAAPFAVAQRPFMWTDLGTGYVARGVKRSGDTRGWNPLSP